MMFIQIPFKIYFFHRYGYVLVGQVGVNFLEKRNIQNAEVSTCPFNLQSKTLFFLEELDASDMYVNLIKKLIPFLSF